MSAASARAQRKPRWVIHRDDQPDVHLKVGTDIRLDPAGWVLFIRPDGTVFLIIPRERISSISSEDRPPKATEGTP